LLYYNSNLHVILKSI